MDLFPSAIFSAQCLFIPLVVAGAIVAMVFAHKQAKKRREAMLAFARSYNLRYNPAHDPSIEHMLGHFEVFKRGHTRRATNNLSGTIAFATAPTEVRLGDYSYKVTSGSGKNRRTTTYRFSYLAAQLALPNLPPLRIRPENMFDRVAGFFGADDIDFESDEFSRRYHVKCPDRKFAYDLIHPRMMDYFLETSPPAIEIEHGRLLVSDGARRWNPEQFDWIIRWTNAFMERWPDHLVNDLPNRGLRR